MKNFLNIFYKIMSVALAIFVIAAGVFFAKAYIKSPGEGEIIDPIVGGRVNILVLALDEGGLLTDTIMLASIDNKRKLVNLMSFPRDTKITIGNSTQKLNSAYAFGQKGVRHESTIKHIKELTGLPINYYVVIHPEGFREVVDALDGVYIDVPMRMYYRDPVQNFTIDLQPGYQLLDGKKAEQFTRFRSGYANADLGRIEAQQNFLKALFEQKLKPQYLLKAADLFSVASDNVDTNISLGKFMDFMPLMNMLSKNGADTSEVLRTFEMPNTPQMINGLSYVVCDTKKTMEIINTEFLGIEPSPTP